MSYSHSKIIQYPPAPKYGRYPSPYAPGNHVISSHQQPFPYFHRCARLHRFFFIATRGVKEILGLVPSNPRHNTSKNNFESPMSGDKADTCFHFVSALSPLSPEIQEEVDTQWRQGRYMSPLSYYLSSINS
jgi:hypothetical protein